jgi:hypothetical protein
MPADLKPTLGKSPRAPRGNRFLALIGRAGRDLKPRLFNEPFSLTMVIFRVPRAELNAAFSAVAARYLSLCHPE